MGTRPLVLVAAADRVVRLLVASALRPAGFRVEQTQGRRPTAEQVVDLRPDVIVMEAEEPPDRAFDAVRELAGCSLTPILLMSSLATPTRVAAGLDAGAADYIARPFDPAELAARVRGLVRRRKGRLHAGRRRVGSAVVDLDARTISRGGRTVGLNRQEWTIVSLLVQRDGAVVLREELLTAAFGETYRNDVAQLRFAIGRVRRKLGLDPWDEGPIRTIHGIGYAFDPDGVLPRSWSGRRGMAAEDPLRSKERGAHLAAGASGFGRR
jgi:DNA-binding response OmpR family regulator